LSKQFNETQNKKRLFPLFLLIGAGVILIFAAIWFVLPKGGGRADQNGVPAITVNPEKIDFGTVKLDTPLSFEFDVTNAGNGTLRFADAPYIEVVEGC
jgi:hypothetical protein